MKEMILLGKISPKKKVLFLVSPIYNYPNIIKNAIEDVLPAKVDCLIYTIPGRIKTFLLNRLSKYDDYIMHNLRNRVEHLVKNRRRDYDYVFVIKGAFIDIRLLEYLRSNLPKATFIYYNWDSFKNWPDAYSIYKLFDKRFSFDRVDCEKNADIKYLPLFHVFGANKPSLLPISTELVFVGTKTPDRLKFLEKIQEQCQHYGLRFKAHIPMSRKYQFWLRFIEKSQLYKITSGNRLSPNEYITILLQSKCQIDMEQQNQSGLTIRTIETLALGRKLITTNKNIAKEKFYNTNNIMIVDRNKPIIKFNFFQTAFEEVPSFYEKYSLRTWIKTIFIETIL
jgi:hypothetical protein